MNDANTSYLEEHQLAEELKDIRQDEIDKHADEIFKKSIADPLSFMFGGYFDEDNFTEDEKSVLIASINGNASYDWQAIGILRYYIHHAARDSAMRVAETTQQIRDLNK